MNKVIISLVISILCTLNVCAQKTSRTEKKQNRNNRINALVKQDEEGLVVYKKQNAYGVFLQTDGVGVMLEKGIRQDRRKTTLYRVELASKKHPKEARFSNTNTIGQINSFVFAKMNNFYQIRMGYGMQYMIGSRGNKNGIEVSAVGVGGISIGLAKPYFYDVEDMQGNRKRLTFDSVAANNYATYGINGASGFSYGWNKLKVKPGVWAKAGLRFDYGRVNEVVNVIGVGLFAEYYTSKIPLLYGVKQRNMFTGAYVTMVFGKRK
jgi:hypothetical protein